MAALGLLAGLGFSGGIAAAQQPLPADRAFSLEARRDAGGLALEWTIAPGTYLYRDSLKASVGSHDLPLDTPPGEAKDDENFGRVEVYHDRVAARAGTAPGVGEMQVEYRGCAEQGICYPLIRKTVDLATLAIGAGEKGTATVAPAPLPATSAVDGPDTTAALLAGGLLPMAFAFLGFGILLAFTPCVFPMIPILSAMLAGAGERLSMARGFALSTAYVLAMAFAYGAVGLAAGWSGANLQTALQTPLALSFAALVFVALALSMFGLFELALPAAITARIAGAGKGGSIGGAAILGFGSALIVGPCVTPPLAAAMLYAMQAGEAVRGAIALFVLGLGMGLPLIAVGTFGSRILPRSGPWLVTVRKLFGAVLLAVAAMLFTRILPAAAGLALWGVLALAAGVFTGVLDRIDASDAEPSWRNRIAKSAGLVAIVYGATLLVGAAAGANDPLRPLAFLAARASGAAPADNMWRVTASSAFDKALAEAATSGRPVLVSFGAAWCTTCKSNEAVMNEPAFMNRLHAVPQIEVDVTTQTDASRALMRRFAIVGPPVLFLVDPDGREIPGSRVIGPITPDDLSRRLAQAGA